MVDFELLCLLVGGIPTPLKNISQLGLLFPIYRKIKNAPNHQPVYYGKVILVRFSIFLRESRMRS